jgi:hypothetical protein
MILHHWAYPFWDMPNQQHFSVHYYNLSQDEMIDYK